MIDDRKENILRSRGMYASNHGTRTGLWIVNHFMFDLRRAVAATTASLIRVLSDLLAKNVWNL